MQYLILFLEGIITFISPCILPMLPIYISYFIGSEQKSKKSALINSIGFVIGFSIIFTILGIGASIFGTFIKQYMNIFNFLGGGILIIFGLSYMDIIKVEFLQRQFKIKYTFKYFSFGKSLIFGFIFAIGWTPCVGTFLGSAIIKVEFLQRQFKIKYTFKYFSFGKSLIFGFIFAIGWTPCVGTFLGSALMIASQSNHMIEGFIMLLVYSLGLGIPFIISALLVDSLKSTFDFIKRNYKVINNISGIFLIVIGVFMMTGYLGKILSFLSFNFN